MNTTLDESLPFSETVLKDMPDHIGRQYRDVANKHILPQYGYLPALGQDDETPVINRSEGVYLYDSTGRKMIDGPGGMWCVQVGHGRKEIAEAVYKQMLDLSYTSFLLVHPGQTELAQRIASKMPGDLKRIYFTTGGSTAVDSALRFCQLYNNVKGRPHKKRILAREKGFHGSTYLAASITGKEREKSSMHLDKEFVHFLSAPCQYHGYEHLTENEFCDFLIKELEDNIAHIGADNIMCFIGEPVMGSGGVIVPPKDYLKRVRETCTKNDIIYIADEVVTGFGRLGHWFVSEEVFGVVPDIITFAKGITSGYVPMGGFAISEKLLQEISGDNADDTTFYNGYTWSGNPVSCAAALASWDIIENEKILEHVREVGPYFQEQLRTLMDIPLVGNVRGMGLMAAVEARIEAPEDKLLEMDTKVGSIVDQHCRDLGLLVRPFANLCIISPPLIITKKQIDDLVVALRKGFELTLEDLRREGIWVD
jgi:putrescine aminotransferase